MSELQFVNLNGDPVDTTQRQSKKAPGAPRVKRVYDVEKATEHHGWEVVGIPEFKLFAAREMASKRGRDFDESSWLNGAKKSRALGRVFVLESSARTAAEFLVRGGGWLRVTVEPILKG